MSIANDENWIPLLFLQRSERLNNYLKKDGSWLQNMTDAPTYYPTSEEFKDPLKYIQSIQAEACKFGELVRLSCWCKLLQLYLYQSCSWNPDASHKLRQMYISIASRTNFVSKRKYSELIAQFAQFSVQWHVPRFWYFTILVEMSIKFDMERDALFPNDHQATSSVRPSS